MTTSTSAEQTIKQEHANQWVHTSGVAAPWQVYSTSSVAFLVTPDVGTTPLVMFPMIIETDPPQYVQEFSLDTQPEKEQLDLFAQENSLQQAVLNLLTHATVPDEPKDEDVRPELGYRFPE